jgi:hypothetical protein
MSRRDIPHICTRRIRGNQSQFTDAVLRTCIGKPGRAAEIQPPIRSAMQAFRHQRRENRRRDIAVKSVGIDRALSEKRMTELGNLDEGPTRHADPIAAGVDA